MKSLCEVNKQQVYPWNYKILFFQLIIEFYIEEGVSLKTINLLTY